MPAKQTHESLASALAAAQGEMRDAQKGARGNFGHYAGLPELRAACIPALSKHGISVVQHVSGDERCATVSTRLLWGSEVLDCGSLTLPFGSGKNAAHQLGSAVTYLRRYTLGAAVMLAASEDDGAGAGDDEGRALAGVRWPSPQKRQQAPTDSKAKITLRHDVGCKGPGDADAVIRYISDDALGLGDLEAQPDVVLGLLERAWERNGHDWSALLPLARGGA